MPVAAFIAIDHVQRAMPEGGEPRAREFCSGILGMTEIPKPLELAKRGAKAVAYTFILGSKLTSRPAKKAHPALRCRDYPALLGRLRRAGIEITEPNDIPGVNRCHVHDPFGNRIEIVSD